MTDPGQGDAAAPIVVGEHLRVLSQVQSRELGPEEDIPAADQAELEATATGSALDAALAARAELRDNGWTQTGEPEILSSEVIESALSEDPPRVVLGACVDSSKVQVTDAAGQPRRDPAAVRPTTNIFTLVFVDGRWRLGDLTFPDDPDC
ncbi:hypothetical protein [Georgenia sp. AZ-5]|uniref:hypothetical protein n=1 Tax=Georgenia sp. AZ-5 TaxID=3367526 RepID=UPI0037547ED6